jgi:hypothetical protein
MDVFGQEKYSKMKETTKDIIVNKFGLDPKKVILVSGGSAWADHIAVTLYNEKFSNRLELYLPTTFNQSFTQNRYGNTLNELHNKFSDQTCKDSLSDIRDAINNGAYINTDYYGFLKRNIPVSKSDYLIAFALYDQPASFGTRYTWNKAKTENRVCVNLNKI